MKAHSRQVALRGIVDVHLHVSGREDDALIPYARRNGLSYTLAELTRSMKECGVSRGLLLSPPLTTGEILPNEDVLALCAKSGGLLSPVLTVPPLASGIGEALSLARKKKGTVKGFKVLLGYVKAFANDPIFGPLYDYAEKETLPVMFHTGDTAFADGSLKHAHPLTLDALANERPGLTMVACHFGNPWIEEVGELIYKHENLYADISGLAVGGSRYYGRYTGWLARKISEAIYFAGGAEKVLFGSDYPVTTQSAAIALVAKLRIETEDRERILSRNASRVFGL
jgi:predicted TIM-barrel fold metal-dependent hydrolase